MASNLPQATHPCSQQLVAWLEDPPGVLTKTDVSIVHVSGPSGIASGSDPANAPDFDLDEWLNEANVAPEGGPTVILPARVVPAAELAGALAAHVDADVATAFTVRYVRTMDGQHHFDIQPLSEQDR